MVDLAKEIDFSQELKEDPKLLEFIQQAAKEIYSELPSDELVKPYINKDYYNFVIVTGLPKAENNKIDVLRKVFVDRILVKLKLKEILKSPVTPDNWGYEDDKREKLNGSIILEFIDFNAAEKAINELLGYILDKNHTLMAFSIYEYERILSTQDQFVKPLTLDLIDQNNYQLDTLRRDQFFIKSGPQLHINWFYLIQKEINSAVQQPIELNQNNKSNIIFSRNGTYLVELNQDGFQLYCGDKLQKTNFYRHTNVKNVEFSPDEQYCISYNGTASENDQNGIQNYIVWHMGQIEKVRTFKAEQSDTWGTFQWSYDGKYIARAGDHQIFVYELPSMKQIKDDKGNYTTIKVPNVQKFCWAETRNIVIIGSYSGNLRPVDQQETKITQVSVFEIPTLIQYKWKSIAWEISDMYFEAQKYGKWVVSIMKKVSKKKVIATIFQIADLRRQRFLEITADEFQGKYHSYTVDTQYGNMAFVQKLESGTQETGIYMRYSIYFYEIVVEDKGIKLKKLSSLINRLTTEVIYSTNGQFFALVNKDPTSPNQGILELGFIGQYVAEITRSFNNISYMTFAQWDPTGRMIITASESLKSYQIWATTGEQIYKDTCGSQGLQAIGWRPRKQNLLTDQEIVMINKNYNIFKKKYEDEDDQIINKFKHEREQKRAQQKKEMLAYFELKQKIWVETKDERIKIRGFDEDDTTEMTIYEEIEMEEILEKIETEIEIQKVLDL